ncbi:E3 ubiquitin-protein ligase CHFR isoform X3 [Oopsacas minuta]|uniref:E3 ubiquitin-protein ligase CHFR n=1 Tax=Oopsacas minuta TaxID=111878 RepID=A0AAV7K055_9METZ|nr:E3 ubiquitin-protein ligase CHFR isoform X3 [Oopsacas minuta]
MASTHCEWGKLEVVKNDSKSDQIILSKTEFTIGRKPTCDYSIVDNPYLSGVHAKFNFHEVTELSYLTDLSANGILLNTVRIKKNTNVELHNGDKITLVMKGASHRLNLHLRLHLLSGENAGESESPFEVKLGQIEAEENGELVKEKPNYCDEDTTVSAIDTLKKVESISMKQVEVLTKAGYNKIPAITHSESFEEQLLCGVCQEIMHMAVSLQPCLHSYCAGCYSEWMEISKDCPACRATVDRIAKNHLVNNLIESYLKSNPGKRRNPECIAELDKKNKITEDLLYPPKRRAHTFLEEDEYYSPSDEEFLAVPPFFPTLLPTHTPFSTSLFSMPGIFTKCRQCPGFIGIDLTGTTPVVTLSSYKCPLTAPTHLICMCCNQPMPDRSTCTDLSVPPQHCDVCKNAYCHMYWGCAGVSCNGCLNEFRNYSFDPAVMLDIVNRNAIESDILTQYLEKKKISINQMLLECLQKLDENEYKCTDSRSSLISAKTRICYGCALKNFRDLAFLYRKDIPLTDLPDDIAARPVCYYGRACKTQTHKPIHASKYNHACEQTRFT